jgi:hypothetical protein
VWGCRAAVSSGGNAAVDSSVVTGQPHGDRTEDACTLISLVYTLNAYIVPRFGIPDVWTWEGCGGFGVTSSRAWKKFLQGTDHFGNA